MRFHLLLLVISMIHGAVIHEPLNVHETKTSRNTKSEIDREIMEALHEIKESRKNIMNEESKVEKNETNPETIGDEIEYFFENILDAFRKSHIPFLSKSTSSNESEAIHHKSGKNTTSENGIISKTRDELKKDIDVLRAYYSKIRWEFDEWVISNKHQNTKSVILGGISAIAVLILYYMVCKCCLRRSRMRHLSSFANDGFASRLGDNDPLLPTKNRRCPSNSDEDI